ncbi:MAG TPA: glycosyltransferase [Puia sp.]|nr:glycosyltransferase [Puia sp.]
MGKRIVVTVISDLVTDQRVHKVCQTLCENGYSVLLIGSRKKKSLPLEKRDYDTSRIPVLFQRTILFYLEFNAKLFFKLFFLRANIFLGNDLDVMAATWLASAMKRKPVIYDTHEYYMEMAGLDHKYFRRKIWKGLETFIFRRVRYIYTISDSFCLLYKKDYNKDLKTVRNVPYSQFHENASLQPLINEIIAKIPTGKHILIFQGAGINPHRGVEELVLAMKWLNPEKYHLLLIGGGDIFSQVENLVSVNNLTDRIMIIPKIPFAALRAITKHAELGLSLDKADNINHRYGLPNKIFDYLHAGVPVLVSRLVELEKIVNQYNVGTFIDSHDPEHIASVIERVLNDPAQLQTWKANTIKVKDELNWEKEGKIVLDIFKQVEAETVN